MKRDEHLTTLQTQGFSSAAAYHEAAFSRNIGLFAKGEQERLAQARIAIPGMGGVGGVHLINLVRTGIGRFNLADFDRFEPVNVNRQFGAKVPSFGRPKLEVMIEEALSINPFLDISPYPAGLTEDNLENFLTGVDVLIDGLDFFQFEIRRALFNKARIMGVTVITAGPLGFSSALLVFTPRGMSFDDYFDVRGDMPDEQKYLRFALGLAPRPTQIDYMDLSRVDLKDGKGPSLNLACQLCASLAATEAVRVILGKPGLRPAPCFLQFDPFRQILRKGRLARGNRTWSQRVKLWYVHNVLLKTSSRARPVMPEQPDLSALPLDPMPRDVGTYLVQAAIQAPSGDNVQPWRFRLTGNDIHVFLNPDADRSFFNVRQTASIIACGAATENIILAATDMGFDATARLLPDTAQENLMATIGVRPGGHGAAPLAQSIWTRCTNRRPYSKRPLPPWLLDDLQNRITDMPHATLHLLTERAQMRSLARLIYMADRIRTEHRGLHEHFASMIRFTAQEASQRRDGLPLKNLEAGLPGEAFLRLTKPWSAMRAVNRIGLGRMVALHSARGILDSGAAGLVVANGLEPGPFPARRPGPATRLAGDGAPWVANAAHDRNHPLLAALAVGRP